MKIRSEEGTDTDVNGKTHPKTDIWPEDVQWNIRIVVRTISRLRRWLSRSLETLESQIWRGWLEAMIEDVPRKGWPPPDPYPPDHPLSE